MSEKDAFKEFESKVLEEWKKGNIVFMSVEGPISVNLDKFIDQPADGILYDLNRSEVVVRTFIKDPKWVNDFAVCKVIRRLKELLDESKRGKK